MNANIRSTYTNTHKNIPNAAVAVLPFTASAFVAVASIACAIILIAFINVVFISIACISIAYNAGAIVSITFAAIAATDGNLIATAPDAASSFSRQKYHLLSHRVDIIVWRLIDYGVCLLCYFHLY
ncbi:hypothetical protein [Paenibacillus algorifonticola]|uniref:hypothetical protein n=1 Tax=Paenibacillus algorifonticola TaxID=684063 RepID=UPI001160CEDB|nr:hypothetical protein [Paenibacillus algorifonticola]